MYVPGILSFLPILYLRNTFAKVLVLRGQDTRFSIIYSPNKTEMKPPPINNGNEEFLAFVNFYV